MIRPFAFSTIVQLKKNYNTFFYSKFSTNIMEIQYSTSGQLFGIVYRVGTVRQTNIPEKF